MWGVPGQQTPTWNITLSLFLGLGVIPIQKLNDPDDVLTTTLKAVRMNTLADSLIFCSHKGTP
jgi:hypothetical protein